MRSLALAALLLSLAVAACSSSDEDEAEREPRPVPNQLREEKIVFARRPALGDDTELYVVNPDGTGLQRLTHDGPREAEDLAPAWSPDGRQIAFVSTRARQPDVPTTGAPPAEEIYVMNADGTAQHRLTQNTRLDLGPKWLPDGRIAFVSCATTENDPPDCELSAIRIGSSERERLAELGFTFEADPSPDGEMIVYSQLEGQSHFQHVELHLADIDGDEDRRLTDNDTGDGSPKWSPDGEQIAFASNRAESARCFAYECAGFTTELYLMDNDGSDVKRLTETLHEETDPSWSPDGAKIAFSRQLDDRAPRELWVMNADGTCPRRLLRGEFDTMPDWYGPAGLPPEPLEC
jgi:TolB protein